MHTPLLTGLARVAFSMRQRIRAHQRQRDLWNAQAGEIFLVVTWPRSHPSPLLEKRWSWGARDEPSGSACVRWLGVGMLLLERGHVCPTPCT